MEFDWESGGDLLFRMFRAITEETEAGSGFRALIEVIAEGFRADSGSLALTVPETEELQVVAALHPSPGQVGRVLPSGEGILGWVVAQGEPLVLHGDASQDPRFQGLSPQRRRPGSAICWPISSGNRIIGALSLNRDAEEAGFSETEFYQGEKLLRLAGVAVDNLRNQGARAREVSQLQVLVEAQRELQQVERNGPEARVAEGSLYGRMAELAARLLGTRHAAVGLFDADGTVQAFHATGIDQATRNAIGGIPEGKGLLGDLFRHPAPERVNDIQADPRFRGFPEGHPDMGRLVAHPLQRGGRTFGVLYAADRSDGLPFTGEDSAYLSMFAAQAVDLLERLELVGALEERAEDLHRQLLNAVKVFANLLELRSPYLSGHASEVADRAAAIGRRLGLDEAYQEDLYIAGLLHDVGMLAMPDTLLRKPYSLLHSGDRKRVRGHPVLGESTLMAMGSLERTARLIRHHHEYLDGSGYPDGLKGEAIPIGARILVVVSEFDDLVQGNLFVGRMAPDKALQYLYEHTDHHYDGDAVAALAEELGMAGDRQGEAPSEAEAPPTTDPNAPGPRKAKRGAPEEESGGNGEKRRRTRKRPEAEAPATEGSGSGVEAQRPVDAPTPVRVLESSRLQEGMILARDLVTEEGMLLLAKGHALDEALIQKIRYFERRLERRFQVAVVDDRKPPDTSG